MRIILVCWWIRDGYNVAWLSMESKGMVMLDFRSTDLKWLRPWFWGLHRLFSGVPVTSVY